MAQDGNPFRTGAVGPFLMFCLALLRFLYTLYALWFLNGNELLLCMWCECFYCYKFCEKMDLAY